MSTNRANQVNFRGEFREDKFAIAGRYRVNGTYTQWTGQTMSCKIWDDETGEVYAEVTTADGITFYTQDTTDDTFLIVFEKALILADVPAGTHRIRLWWEEAETTLFSGKVNFVEGAP